MLDLLATPFFAELPPAGEQAARRVARLRRYSASEVVVSKGADGTEFHIIAAGTAAVILEPEGVQQGQLRPGSPELPSAQSSQGVLPGVRRIFLAPGQSFGEMAVLSGLPVSATVTALGELATYCIAKAEFLALLDEYPVLYKRVAGVLIDRLRHRTSSQPNRLRAPVAVLLCPPDGPAEPSAAQALLCAVRAYAPASALGDMRSGVPGAGGLAAAQAIGRWRAEAGASQYLLLQVDRTDPEGVIAQLEFGDVVLMLAHGEDRPPDWPASADATPAVHRHMIVVRAPRTAVGSGVLDAAAHTSPDAATGAAADGDWAFGLPAEEIEAACAGGGLWTRERYPMLDRIARYITCREVGVAMSVGAAAGFAHFGVLSRLEEAGIALDCLCGASMGGLVALACGRYGSAREAARQFGLHLNSNRKLRDPAWLPRSALLLGHKSRGLAAQVFGQITLAQLDRPTAVVAADLVSGQRIVLDRGPAEFAARATSAIPGLLPPVQTDSAMLVDGGVVSRIPVDVLARRRCGYRLAVAVLPERAADPGARQREAGRLRREINAPFGFRTVIGMSWKLLGSWDATAQARSADQVIAIHTPWAQSFNFASAQRMVALGHQAAEQHLAEIRLAVQAMLQPGTP